MYNYSLNGIPHHKPILLTKATYALKYSHTHEHRFSTTLLYIFLGRGHKNPKQHVIALFIFQSNFIFKKETRKQVLTLAAISEVISI